MAIGVGIAIRLLVSIPILLAKGSLRFVGLFTDLNAATWDDRIVHELDFLQNSVLQVPFFLMSLLRSVSPAMDDLFMKSLDWVDRTYVAKHASDDTAGLRAMYYPNLMLYRGQKPAGAAKGEHRSAVETVTKFLLRFGRKAAISLTILLLSYIPYVGKLVIPAVSFYYFKSAVGTQPALVVFATGLILPRRFVIRFLQTYFSSRTMMRELVSPPLFIVLSLLTEREAPTVLYAHLLHA